MRKEEKIQELERNIVVLEQQIEVWQNEINRLEGLVGK